MGRLTATSGNNFYFPAGTIGTFHTKFHHSTRIIDRYVDKAGKKAVSAVNSEPIKTEQIIEEDPVAIKERELRRLKELIKSEQKKIKICTICKRKFANYEQLKKHEDFSEMHKSNAEKMKLQNKHEAKKIPEEKKSEIVEMELDS